MATKTKKAATYYAIDWTYGRASNSDGGRCGCYVAFASRAERDAFVAERPTEYSTQAGYREPIAASDPELRRELRKQGGSPLAYGERVYWHGLHY